ncbi:hypothetical protein RJ639_006079 [Escallonia herrerae]|uniref:non-specific serine/threonine protein kinase n=1 Tax=Escallonia herrerae TaxID=1293975 RepID=A0AA88VYC0_9ASTE|nr:hypothetical protein RJ639_006079 [Escallonia herrerae]
MTIYIPFIFFLIVPSVSGLNFNLSTIGTDDANRSINTTGDAYISSEGIQVTPNERNMALGGKTGRATYVQPLHLWDKTSGNLTDFTTHFSFVIDSSGNNSYADGLAFFLAPMNSTVIRNEGGSGLGLASGNQTSNSSGNQFVAVEFDTFPNYWDPRMTHVGININSMKSVTTAVWLNDIKQGKENDAWISYNSSSRSLGVVFTGFSINNTRQGSLNYVVDLRDYLPEWVTFGFSAATGLSLGLSVGLSVVLVGLALVGYVLWKKRNVEELQDDEFGFGMSDEFEKGSGPKKFSYSELTRATSNFSEEEKLGEGGFGGVYRGFLRELNSHVAIKRVSKGSKQGVKEYASEVKIISKLRHRNLVQLIGWCHEKKELLLVYELMPNGSLDYHLFKGKILLTWGIRYKIARGLASALLYLHEEWEQCVVHRDIKSSNVMLDSSFNAKLGDFGLARFVDHEKGSQTTVLAGTMGYLAPECFITGKASKESDVFSFGVLALEITCGRKPIDPVAAEGQIRMVEWVWELYGKGKLLEAADPKLSADFDQQEMEYLMIVGLWCSHPDSNLRPSIRQAIHVLNLEAPLPILPPKMPVASYLTPSLDMPAFSVSLADGATASESSQAQSSSYSYSTESSKLTASSATDALELVWLKGRARRLKSAALMFLEVRSSTAWSFNPNIHEIEYHGEATPSDPVIQLTRNQSDKQLTSSTGIVTYHEPMHLWDKTSGNLADFTTKFSFIINSQNRLRYADGMTFFLAPVGFRIPDVQDGSSPGLVSGSQELNSTLNPFVAVEFDTFRNSWDPPNDHVGININSMISVKTKRWWSLVPYGLMNAARISYNSSTKNLSVVFTGFFNNTVLLQHLSITVDLRKSNLQVGEGLTGQLGPAPAQEPPISEPIIRSKRKTAVGLLVGASAFVVLCGLGFIWFGYRRKLNKGEKKEEGVLSVSCEFERETGPKKFSYKELAIATKNFSEEEKVGEGGFGGVYKGFLGELNSNVAVKRVSRGSKQGLKEYASEVKIISRLRHRNLVQLIGWCHEERELLLVYEFMPNGSLDTHLFKENGRLTWEMRYKIAQGLASALLYLHEGWEQCVLHRDIKSSNVMLDSSFNAKLGDFGLARLVDHAKESQTTLLAGTMGYMAPESIITGKAGKGSDVYSFGIAALEIASGRKPIDPMARDGQIRLVDRVWDLYGLGKLVEAADPKLNTDFDVKQMECLLTIGLWCAHQDPNLRPSMKQAIQVLNFEALLPSLPLRMPTPTIHLHLLICLHFLFHRHVALLVWRDARLSPRVLVTTPIPPSSLLLLKLLVLLHHHCLRTQAK